MASTDRTSWRREARGEAGVRGEGQGVRFGERGLSGGCGGVRGQGWVIGGQG